VCLIGIQKSLDAVKGVTTQQYSLLLKTFSAQSYLAFTFKLLIKYTFLAGSAFGFDIT